MTEPADTQPPAHQSITLTFDSSWPRRPWRLTHVLGDCVRTVCCPSEEALLTAVAGMLPRLAERGEGEHG